MFPWPAFPSVTMYRGVKPKNLDIDICQFFDVDRTPKGLTKVYNLLRIF